MSGWDSIDWGKTLTAAVGVATLVQAVVAVMMVRGLRHARRQADAAQASLIAIERTAERQLRAYLLVTSAVMSTPKQGEPVRLTIARVNAGQTPAHDVEIATVLEIRDPLDVPRFGDIPDNLNTDWPLGPDCSSYSECWLPRARWEGVSDELRAGELVVVVYGMIRYRDIFGAVHMTRFHVADTHRFVGGDLFASHAVLGALVNDAT